MARNGKVLADRPAALATLGIGTMNAFAVCGLVAIAPSRLSETISPPPGHDPFIGSDDFYSSSLPLLNWVATSFSFRLSWQRRRFIVNGSRRRRLGTPSIKNTLRTRS